MVSSPRSPFRPQLPAPPRSRPPKRATTAAPVAVQAPEAAAPQASSAFGVIGFTATAKPKPKPKPKPRRPRRGRTARPQQRVDREPVHRPQGPTPAWPAAGGVLAIAAQYEGIMYCYGGTTPSTGFDCSGFTPYVFRQVGISLPRTAEAQRGPPPACPTRSRATWSSSAAPAYHVGIYAGNGMMWDSPRSGKAVALRSIWSSNVTYGRP